MNVKFDAIAPVPTPRQRDAARQRLQERQERQSRSTAQRREQLLDVAQTLIETHSVEGLNMRLIAREAGYTAGALYAYFNGKEVILAALQRRVLERLAQSAANARAAKGGRSSPAGDEGAERDAASTVAVARGMFVAQALAWWRYLARDPDSLQLLLLRAGPAPAAAGATSPGAPDVEFQGAAAGVAALEDALDVCRKSLMAMGIQEAVAYQLHRELVACGLGLLLLATASGHAQPGGLERQWTGALHRWLQSASAPEVPAERSAAKSKQQDLFVA